MVIEMYSLVLGPGCTYYASQSMLMSGVEVIQQYKSQGLIDQEVDEVNEALYRQAQFLHAVSVEGRG